MLRVALPKPPHPHKSIFQGLLPTPMHVVDGVLGTNSKGALTQAAVASQVAFSTKPFMAGVHRLCGHLHVLLSLWSFTVYRVHDS